MYLPQTTPEQYKESVNQQNTVYLNSCPILYPATLEENQMNNHDLHRVLFGNHAMERKCINSCTGLGVG